MARSLLGLRGTVGPGGGARLRQALAVSNCSKMASSDALGMTLTKTCLSQHRSGPVSVLLMGTQESNMLQDRVLSRKESQRVLPACAVTSCSLRNTLTLFLEFIRQNKYHYPAAELTHAHTLRQTLWITFMLAIEAACGAVDVKKARHVVTDLQRSQAAAGRK